MDRVGLEFLKNFWCWSDLRFSIFLRTWSGASPCNTACIPEKVMSSCGWIYAMHHMVSTVNVQKTMPQQVSVVPTTRVTVHKILSLVFNAANSTNKIIQNCQNITDIIFVSNSIFFDFESFQQF